MKCKTLAQLQPPPSDPLRILLLAVLVRAVKDARKRMAPQGGEMDASEFLASPEVREWVEEALEGVRG